LDQIFKSFLLPSQTIIGENPLVRSSSRYYSYFWVIIKKLDDSWVVQLRALLNPPLGCICNDEYITVLQCFIQKFILFLYIYIIQPSSLILPTSLKRSS